MYIVLTPEQAKVVREAIDLVEVRDEGGAVLARILPPAEAAIVAESRRRLASGNPLSSMAQVRARLQKLEEISQREPLDSVKARELLRRMRAGEEV